MRVLQEALLLAAQGYTVTAFCWDRGGWVTRSEGDIAHVPIAVRAPNAATRLGFYLPRVYRAMGDGASPHTIDAIHMADPRRRRRQGALPARPSRPGPGDGRARPTRCHRALQLVRRAREGAPRLPTPRGLGATSVEHAAGAANAILGVACFVDPSALVGLRYRHDCHPAVIGDRCVIRALTVVYADVVMGAHVKTGHHVTIREHTRICDYVVVGSGTVIDGNVTIGSYVKIESQVYIPTHTTIGSFVFLGPRVVLTNDKYPLRLRDRYEPRGPILEDNVTVGANATILPGVRIGEGSMIAAGSVVTRDVPPWSLAKGAPARVSPLPDSLRQPNRAKKW